MISPKFLFIQQYNLDNFHRYIQKLTIFHHRNSTLLHGIDVPRLLIIFFLTDNRCVSLHSFKQCSVKHPYTYILICA